MVARMTSGGWIISHRCSWIIVYVLYCNAQVNLIVILVTFVCYLYSINCPTVICLPSMLLFILWETPLVDCGPRSILLHCYYCLLFICFIYILANYYLLPLDTLNPLFIENWWDWQPHCELGQSTWLCCVQVPRCCWCKATPWTSFLAPLSRAVAKLASFDLLKFGSFSYWFNKPWFHNWRKTCCYAHHNLLLGFSNWAVIYNIPTSTPHHQQVFWHRCRGERRFLQGESLASNLLLCFCFALFYFCLHLFIKNTKN
jgi:hypothetical protein